MLFSSISENNPLSRGRTGWKIPGMACVCVLFFAATTLLLLIIVQSAHYLDATLLLEQHKVSSQQNISRARSDFTSYLRHSVGDINLLNASNDLELLTTSTNPAEQEAAQQSLSLLFFHYLTNKPDISQLRFLNINGMEILRTERRRDGSVFSVDSANLQNKAGRYYFRETLVLPQGRVYLSPLDLNIENGEIEQPWHPVIRIAAPVVFDNITQGVLIMNLDTGRLLQQITSGNSSQRRISLLNEDGFWITGAPASQLWGFMFNKPTHLEVQVPALWKQINARKNGELNLNGQHYLYEVLHLDDILPDMLTRGSLISHNSRWIFLSQFAEPTPILGWHDWPVLLALTVASALLSAVLSRTMNARRRAESLNQQNEKRIAELDRLASLGNVVAGVAHEVNTPVGNALTIASTLHEYTDELMQGLREGRMGRSRLESLLQEMEDGTSLLTSSLQRASNIISNFKQVAVDQASERRRQFNLADFIEEVSLLINAQLPHRLHLTLSASPDLNMNSYPGALSQVIINLVNNAVVHAFEEDQNGEILVSAFRSDDGVIIVKVSDNGRGIPAKNLQRIFDPFFTTRLNTGGSGLGLSIVHGLVNKSLGGTIRVYSEPGSGTSFTVELPVNAPEPDEKNQQNLSQQDLKQDQESSQGDRYSAPGETAHVR